jgi:Arm DNA-binding domain
VALTLFSSPVLKPQKRTPMSLPTTAVVHNWHRLTNKSGLYPIYLRITIDRVQKYEMIPVPVKISKEQCIGEDDNWVRDDHPFFFEINCKIRGTKASHSKPD